MSKKGFSEGGVIEGELHTPDFSDFVEMLLPGEVKLRPYQREMLQRLRDLPHNFKIDLFTLHRPRGQALVDAYLAANRHHLYGRTSIVSPLKLRLPPFH